MKRLFGRIAAAIGAALILSACGGSTAAPAGISVEQPTTNGVTADARVYNFSGEYSGLITDSVHGTGKAKAKISQEKTALGGAMTIGGSPTIAYFSWIAAAAKVDGSSVFVSSSGYCSFSNTATYNTTTFVLAGSYKAVHGCTGETGAYKLKHHCYYKMSAANDIRPETGPHPC